MSEFTVTQENIRALLPFKIAQICAKIQKAKRCSPHQALLEFYASGLYRELEDESTKRWWESPEQLFATDEITVGQWLAFSPELAKQMHSFHPVESASVFAGLLLDRRFHMHTLRLELLVHFCVAFGGGTLQMDAESAHTLFTKTGMLTGIYEHVPTNDFLQNIAYADGNARVLEGIRKDDAFCLQRFVGMADRWLNNKAYRNMREAVHALLKLSDLLFDRVGLERREPGGQPEDASVLHVDPERVIALQQQVSFTTDELKASDINPSALEPFMYDLSRSQELKWQIPANSDLTRQPLVHHNEHITVLFPTAVSAAIYNFIRSGIPQEDSR